MKEDRTVLLIWIIAQAIFLACVGSNSHLLNADIRHAYDGTISSFIGLISLFVYVGISFYLFLITLAYYVDKKLAA